MRTIVRLAMSPILCTPALMQAQVMQAQVTALRVGHLVDPETGTAAANQVILIKMENFPRSAETLPSRPAQRWSTCRSTTSPLDWWTPTPPRFDLQGRT